MWLPDEDAAEVSALPVCTALSEFNTQIRSFKLTAPQTMISGAVVHYVFPKSDAMPALEVLSVLSAQGIANITEFLTPEQLLRLALVNASTMFPNLRKLHMNTYHDALPRLPSSASFSHLTKLILDGSSEHDSPRAEVIAALLHCTLQLESLWMKHLNYEPNRWHTVQGRSISKNILLPKLKHLAVSIPGSASDLIGCIRAPALEDLHLDRSRGPSHWHEYGPPFPIHWNDEVLESIYNMLKLFAITQAHLSQSAWNWLLFGEDERGPPFPKLESIALRGVYEYYDDDTWTEFDHLLMEKFARNPMIPLKRLALLDCDFRLCASVLVDAFRASGAKELVCDKYVPQWEGGEREQFDELRVTLTWHESRADEDEWWTREHEIDATDSKAY
jgi:hypothetical protein